jgi:hypothetical protein
MGRQCQSTLTLTGGNQIAAAAASDKTGILSRPGRQGAAPVYDSEASDAAVVHDKGDPCQQQTLLCHGGGCDDRLDWFLDQLYCSETRYNTN